MILTSVRFVEKNPGPQMTTCYLGYHLRRTKKIKLSVVKFVFSPPKPVDHTIILAPILIGFEFRVLSFVFNIVNNSSGGLPHMLRRALQGPYPSA